MHKFIKTSEYEMLYATWKKGKGRGSGPEERNDAGVLVQMTEEGLL